MKYSYGFFIFFLFVILKVQGRTHTQRQIHLDSKLRAESCNSINFTFVFVMDVSSSVDPDDWKSQKQIVKNFVKSSSFGENKNVDVAVVTFSNDAVIELSCGQLTSKMAFFSFMDSLAVRGGGSGIGSGLLKAQEVYKSCPKNNNFPVVILLTDGMENIDRRPFRLMTETQIKREALLVAGGVRACDRDEIDRISGYDVNGERVSNDFFAEDFSSFLAIYGRSLYPFVLHKSQCKIENSNRKRSRN